MVVAGACFPAAGQPPRATAPHVVRPAAQPTSRPNSGENSRPGRPAQPQQHLSQWIEAHRNLPLVQQQSALEAEPGFRQLNPEVQQHMHQRLTQLNNMPPVQRDKVLARTEAMEQLSQPQRQQVRGAMQQLGSLPEDRRHAVARSFHQLREMPEAQRQSYLSSPAMRGQFNEQELGTLNHLLQVAPLLPAPGAANTPPR